MVHVHGHNCSHGRVSDVTADSGRLVRIATWASLIVAFILIIAKFAAWMITDSVSVLSSLVDSSMDLLMSAVNFITVRYAYLPPDDDHKFGHTAAEDVSALAQAAFIGGSAIVIAYSAIHSYLHPEQINSSEVGIWVMVLSIVMTGFLVSFQKYVSKRSKSPAIHADSLHYITDLLTNLGVIIAIIASTQFGFIYADPIFGMAMAIYIFWGAWQIGKRAFDNMLDKELPDSERQKIMDFVLAQPEAKGLHHLKTRSSGIKTFIQFHLEMDGNQKLYDAHKAADRIEKDLMKMYPGSEVMIHQDINEDD
jgi:ferrous-iron efflux pump FieF